MLRWFMKLKKTAPPGHLRMKCYECDTFALKSEMHECAHGVFVCSNDCALDYLGVAGW